MSKINTNSRYERRKYSRRCTAIENRKPTTARGISMQEAPLQKTIQKAAKARRLRKRKQFTQRTQNK